MDRAEAIARVQQSCGGVTPRLPRARITHRARRVPDAAAPATPGLLAPSGDRVPRHPDALGDRPERPGLAALALNPEVPHEPPQRKVPRDQLLEHTQRVTGVYERRCLPAYLVVDQYRRASAAWFATAIARASIRRRSGTPAHSRMAFSAAELNAMSTPGRKPTAASPLSAGASRGPAGDRRVPAPPRNALRGHGQAA